MRLRPASKYSGCRLRQERPGSAVLAKKRGNRWCEPGDRGPANSCRPITQVPPRWAAGPEQAIARTGVTRAPRSHPHESQSKPSPPAPPFYCLARRRPGGPGSRPVPGGRAEDAVGRSAQASPQPPSRPAARAADPRHPTPRAASPPPRRAAGWT